MERAVVFSALLAGYLLLYCTANDTPKWWSLGFHNCTVSYGSCPNCHGTGVFNPCQEQLCSRFGENEMVRAVGSGLREAVQGCQEKFSNTPWNCTSFNGDHLFGRFIDTYFTRETALLYAMMTAGTKCSVASACQKGVIDGCPCILGQSRREGDTTYIQKCNDNVDFATEFTNKLYGCQNCNKTVELVVEWNNELACEAVDNTTPYCRCTGLSGSCVVQTCYEKAPEVEDVISKLREKYEGSQKVGLCGNSLCIIGRNRRPIEGFPVYLDNTPDPCSPSPEDGILGTRGRECNPSSSGSNSCVSLCCNNGFESISYNVTNERCRFVWCCRIECVELPPTLVTEYRCL